MIPNVFFKASASAVHQPALFGVSLFDCIASSTSKDVTEHNHYDRCWVSLGEKEHSAKSVVLQPSCETSLNSVAFGRARHSPSFDSDVCPTVGLIDLYKTNRELKNTQKRYPYVRLGVVGLVVDQQDNVLITRRASHMRTFPGAWVLPGGGLEPSDQKLIDAVIREVKEETGVQVTDPTIVQPLGCWESCFPTTVEECLNADSPGIASHYLVLYYLIQLENITKPTLKIQQEELDMAAWLTKDTVKSIIQKRTGFKEAHLIISTEETSDNTSIDGISGIYSNDNLQGTAQGTLFILEELINSNPFGRF